jgi:MFS superfamily sulfate permease-like transporter
MRSTTHSTFDGLRPDRVPLPWGDVRGASLSALLSLITTVSYGAVAAGSISSMGPGVVSAMVLSGLIAASLGALVASAFGSVPTQIFSPRASVAVVIAAAAASFSAGDGVKLPQVLALLSLCLFLAMLLQLAFAALKLGGLIRLIPTSVTAGLVIALALRLVWSELPDLVAAPDRLRPWAPLCTAIGTFGVFALLRARYGAGGAMLAGLAAGLLVALVVDLGAPGALPHLPSIDLAGGPLLPVSRLVGQFLEGWPPGRWIDVLAFAAVIALVNSVETLTSAMQIEDLGTQRFDANRALLAGALGSLVSLLAGGLPVAGGTSTSSVHVQAGATSRSAAFASAMLVGLGTLVFASVIVKVPLAVVAALMLCVAGEIAVPPVRELLAQWQADRRGMRGELAVVLIVCVLMLSADILVAVAAGVVAASVLAFVQMRDSLVRREYNATDAMAPTIVGVPMGHTGSRDVPVIEIGQPLFFATVEAAVHAVERVSISSRQVVLDLTRSGGLDLTAAKALSRCAAVMQRDERQLLVVGGERIAEMESPLRPCLVFGHIGDAVNYCTDAQGLRDLEVERVRREAQTVPQAVIEHATRLLAEHIGPIAEVLVRRAASVVTNRDQFCNALAGQLDESRAREAFLAGMKRVNIVRSAS